MRKLVIARGLPGSGKSTFLANCGLAAHIISLDAIRLVLSGAQLTIDGRMSLPQQHGGKVWAMARESLAVRMARGETIAFDATLPHAKDLTELAKLAAAERYELLIVDFYGLPLDTVFRQNAMRPEERCVSHATIDRFLGERQDCPPELCSVDVAAVGHDAAINAVRDFLTEGSRMIDLSHYRRIVHIGDLQGCLSPLVSRQSPIASGFDDDTFYVFHGDYLDRGLENAQVIRWLDMEAVHRDNVAFLEGNHEDHIRILLAGRPAVSREFERRTLPALRAGGITDAMLARLTDRLITVLPYYWNGYTVLASHAGFPRWPTALELVPDLQFRIGPGYYTTPIDEMFSEWAQDEGPKRVQGMLKPTREIWQVHGHRNQPILPVIAGERSINLEGQVEFGGKQRFAILDSNGWTAIEVRNHNFRSMQDWRQIDVAEGRKPHGQAAPIAPWIERGEPVEPAIDPATLSAFRNHEMVAERVSDRLPHISALNFSKQAFWGKAWDDITMRTRGLFVDTEDCHIVARSYEKFFNWGERTETSDEALEKTLAFPVTGYLKENGYLGISGYDRKTDSLILASKSMIDGDFAEWFAEIAHNVLGEGGLERLLRFNRDQGASCVFEVIDPVRDPHIIAYEEPTIILLAAVRRAEEFEQLPYSDLVKLAKHLGCSVKQQIFHVPYWPALQRTAHEAMSNIEWAHRRNQAPSEGFVIEDANGFHVKVKGRFYAFWKQMRGAKDRVLSARRSNKPIDLGRYTDDPLALSFVEFCQKQPDDVLDRDIIWLRNAFLNDSEQVIIIDKPPPAPKVPDQTGFLKGVDAIATQIEAGTAKQATVERMIQKASECEHRQAAFDDHPKVSLIRQFAGFPEKLD